MTFENIRAEIERMRLQVTRQRRDIKDLQSAGIHTSSAEALLARMQANVDDLCSQRDKLAGEQRRRTYAGTDKAIRGPQMRFR